MSQAAREWAREIRTGSASRKSVLLCLAGYADEVGGSCYVGVSRIMAETELSRDTVVRVLAELRSAGWIAVDVAGAGRRATSYLLAVRPPDHNQRSDEQTATSGPTTGPLAAVAVRSSAVAVRPPDRILLNPTEENQIPHPLPLPPVRMAPDDFDPFAEDGPEAATSSPAPAEAEEIAPEIRLAKGFRRALEKRGLIVQIPTDRHFRACRESIEQFGLESVERALEALEGGYPSREWPVKARSPLPVCLSPSGVEALCNWSRRATGGYRGADGGPNLSGGVEL
ncbi:MAG TPA: hypothetical protein DCQ64_33445 [Candidatus Rokubacteria bacterium]|nr:hypothetical protein [Candidatus Rokubacteria bacterium]